jgi:peptidyl-prolyl cis-trans isomerase D
MIRVLQNAGSTVKIILGALLVLICASMVITLVPGGFGSSFGFGATPGQGVVATVGDEQVTAVEVQRQARAMAQQQFPKGGPQLGMLIPFFTSQAAQQLINEKAIIAEGHRLGLHASDEEVRNELQHGGLAADIFPDGKFIGTEQYETYVQSRFNWTVPQFEERIKDSIVFRKLQALVSTSAFVGDSEVRQEFERRNTKVKFDYAVLTQADILKALHPTDQELRAYFDRNKANPSYAVPEKRQIKYAVIDAAKLAATTQVAEQDLQTYYDQHRDEYRMPEQVKVSHILIKTPLPGPDGKVDDKAVEASRKKAEDVLKQVKSGGDFAKLAQQNSDDPGSAKQGGDLGWIGRGRTVPEFEKAAFSLPKGQTSDLVKSTYGFHIIRVMDKQDAHVKLLAEVKPQIIEQVKQQKVARAAEVAANALVRQARTDGIDKAAAAVNLHVVTTEFFSRNDNLPGVETTPQFMDTVFNESEKAPPDLAQTPQGYVVFELLGIKPPATPTFEDVRSRIETEFKNERAGVLLQQKTQELSDRAKAEHDLKKAAKELGASLKTSDFVLPDGQVPDVGSMSGAANVVFNLKPGEISAPINNGSNGVVAYVLDKQQPTDQDFAQKKDEIRQGLLQNKQQELFGLFVTNLRKDMENSKKIKINQEEMKNLTRRGAAEEGS